MSWELTNAVGRIFRAFKRSGKLIYKEDIEALKLLNDTISEKEIKYVSDNLLYAKLILYLMRTRVLGGGNIKEVLITIQSEFKTPMSAHFELLTKALNSNDKVNFLKGLGFDMDTLADEPDLISKQQKEMSEKLLSGWTQKSVEKSFYNSANDFLKDIENYK